MDLALALNIDASSASSISVVSSVICEPYDTLSSAQLREEVSRRRIPTIRTGPDTNYNKAGFIKLLRDDDRAVRQATAADSIDGTTEGSAATNTVASTVANTVAKAVANAGAIAVVNPVANTVVNTVANSVVNTVANSVANTGVIPVASTGANTVASAAAAPPAGTRTRTPTRIPHCAIRLLNVLFSDAFAPRFAEMDAPAERDGAFWSDVRAAFLSDNPTYMNKISTHPALTSISPKIYAAHSAEKLKSIWSEVVRAHQRASAEMAKVGTHESDFFKFCRGNANALYLNCWLERRPELRPEARLSVAPRASARAPVSMLRPRPTSASELSDPSSAKRHRGHEQLAADDRLKATVRGLVVEEVLAMVRALADATGERARVKKEKAMQSQWLELAVGIDALRDRVKRHRPGTSEYIDAERDLMYALNRKQKLQEELGN